MALTTKPKPSLHHRKSRGGHHRHDKPYLKTYHPFLPLLLLVIIGLAINSFWSKPVAILGAQTEAVSAASLAASTNQERHNHHQRNLKENPQLDAAAQAKVLDMVRRGYWSHTSPSGTTPWQFVQAAGYRYQAAGENLAYGFGSAPATVAAWMNSPEHRANLLSSRYSEVGYGVVNATYYRGNANVPVVVALYGSPSPANGSKVLGASTTAPPLKSVSRIQLMTIGQAPWSFVVLSLIGLISAGYWLVHATFQRGLLRRSQAYVKSHVCLDIGLGCLVLAALILTRTAGFIH